jgi:hypothetical protein
MNPRKREIEVVKQRLQAGKFKNAPDVYGKDIGSRYISKLSSHQNIIAVTTHLKHCKFTCALFETKLKLHCKLVHVR